MKRAVVPANAPRRDTEYLARGLVRGGLKPAPYGDVRDNALDRVHVRPDALLDALHEQSDD